VDNNEHHPALLGRFVIVAPSINVQIYLLTYLKYTTAMFASGILLVRVRPGVAAQVRGGGKEG